MIKSNAEFKGKENGNGNLADEKRGREKKKERKKKAQVLHDKKLLAHWREAKKHSAAQIIFWLRSNSSLIVLPSMGDLSSRLWKLTGGPFGMVMLSYGAGAPPSIGDLVRLTTLELLRLRLPLLILSVAREMRPAMLLSTLLRPRWWPRGGLGGAITGTVLSERGCTFWLLSGWGGSSLSMTISTVPAAP